MNYNKFPKSLLYLLRFCYVFVFNKGSNRNNYKKDAVHIFQMNLVLFQTHNFKPNTFKLIKKYEEIFDVSYEPCAHFRFEFM